MAQPGSGSSQSLSSRSASGEELGEYLEIEGPDGHNVSEAPDGGWYITLGQSYEEPRDRSKDGFYANLAEELPDDVLSTIGSDLLRFIELDRDGREERTKQYEEGLKRTGMGKEAPGGADFEGASRVVHPALSEACIDYEARIMKELWPPAGPVRQKLLGKATAEKTERAERKVEYMNYQLTVEMEEARAAFETMFTQLPLGGSQFIRLWFDHRLKRPRTEFVPVDKMLLPASAANFTSASRRSYLETITTVDYKQRVDQGLYRQLPHTQAPAQVPDPNAAEKSAQKIEGVKKDSLNLDGEREICETMYFMEVTPKMADALGHEKEGELYPYLVTIDTGNKQVLSVYRDWEENDERRKPIEHLFEFRFIPWRGAYAIGLIHLIGGLSGAATGALRALLDSAHIANMQGGFFLKGSGTSGQDAKPSMGTLTELTTGIEAQDIRKTVMMFNTKEPSTVLFSLLGFVVEAAKGVVRTSMDESAIDTNTNVPVGTQLSRVEQGMVVFSEIHARTHASFDRYLAGLHRLNRLYLPKRLTVDAAGQELMVRRKDFEGPPDVMPVSDPTVYSDQQRWAQLAEIERAAINMPTLYKMRPIQQRKLKLLKVANPEELLVDQPQPHELNAVNENAAMAFGRPVIAFPEQDHLAHLQCHLDFLRSPVFGMNPILAPKILPAGLKHCAEHMVYEYVRLTDDMVMQASRKRTSELMSRDDEIKRLFDRLLGMASQRVLPQCEQQFTKALAVLQQGMQALKQLAPPPPMDPAQAGLQAAQAETQRKTQADQAEAQVSGAKVQSEHELGQQKNANDAERNQIAARNADVASHTKIVTTEMDNRTAEEIASERAAMGQSPRFSDGASLQGK